MKNDFSMAEIESTEEKSLICNQILNALPNWFGVPESVIQYTEQVKHLPLFAYKLREKTLGFIAIEQTNANTAEIVVMGILPDHHRQGIGKELLCMCERYCLEHSIECLAVKTLAATRPSKSYEKTRAFYHAMGFCSQMILTDYWDENNPCLFMIKALDSQVLNAIQMQAEHIEFVYDIKFSEHNNSALHGGEMSLDEWTRVCNKNLADFDEVNFIIRQGNIPIAWLKVNGLENENRTAWISMLVVHEKYQQQGIGSFSVQFAEDFVRAKGFEAVGIHTNVDNVAAQKCYKKLGYTIIEEGECTNGDGKKRRGLTFYRDHLDAVRMSIDDVPFHVGEYHDFSFLSSIGKVFRVFDAMDSGNICFGVEHEDKQYFVKYAGARTMDYKGEIDDAVSRLKVAVSIYEDLQHPYLIQLVDHYPIGCGYVAIFDWVNGEGLFSYWDYVGQAMSEYPTSPNYRFRHLQINKRVESIDRIMEFHQHVIERGYVPIDFYDGSLLYDFDADKIYICDIDFYRKMPTVNDMGKIWGSSRFMAPEEYEMGAPLDEVKTIYNMGTTMFELLGGGLGNSSFGAWSTTKSLYDVAIKAISKERSDRYRAMTELIETWNRAKGITNIEYRQLCIEDINSDMLMSFNRYQKVTASWRKYGSEYKVKETTYVENWDENKKSSIINEDFPEALESGGAVLAAYDSGKLVGFAFYDGRPIGSQNQYYWLVMLHVSYEYRNKGIGKKLFKLCAESAKQCGAKRFYISANSSIESQAFYRSIGCIPAEEVNQNLFDAEPYDVHMEYAL